MTERLEGRVANILNEREVAVNIGARDGVEVGMKFAILSPNPIAIVDPASKETLGEVDRPKVRVKASEVQDRFSILRTYETYTANVGGTGTDFLGGTLSIFTPPKWVRRVKTLRVDESDLPGELTPADSIVKVNDRVVQIVDSEDDAAQ